MPISISGLNTWTSTFNFPISGETQWDIGLTDAANALANRTTYLYQSIASTSGNYLQKYGGNTIYGDQTIWGNVNISGTLNYIDTQRILVADQYLVINASVTGSPIVDGGLIVERGTSTDATIKWNETTDKWQAGLDGSEVDIVVSTDLLPYITTATTAIISGGLDTRLTTVESNYATKSNTIIAGTYNNVVVNSQGIVTSGGNILATIPTSGSFLSDYDARYVNVSGDTMTGKLTTPAINLPVNNLLSSSISGDLFYYEETLSPGEGLYFNANGNIKQLDFDSNTAGPIEKIVLTDNGNGTINAPSIKAYLFSNSNWTGSFKHYHIPAANNLALTDNSVNYLVANYNSGSPIYQVVTDPALINNSNVVLMATMSRIATEIHWIAVDWGLATATKVNNRQINIKRFERSSGLALSETATSIINISSGVIWYGSTSYSVSGAVSSSSNADFWYHSSGNWVKTTVSTYNNSQIDNGTNLVALSANDYTVNWVYRYLDGDGLPKIAYVLGSGSPSITYPNLADAKASTVPSIPTILERTAILVGRIIVRNGQTTAAQIDSAFTQTFAGSIVTDHSNLSGLQGGTAGQYYHLTSSQYNDYIGASTVAIISGGLDTRLTTVEGNYATKATPNAGTYNNVVVNSQGVVTSGGNLGYALTSSIPTSATFLTDYDDRYVNESDLPVTLSNYTLLSTTATVSGGLDTRLTTVENNYATKATPVSGTYNNVIVNSQGVVTSGGNIVYVIPSDLNVYTLLSTTATVSGGLNTRVTNLENAGYITSAALIPYTLTSTTASISGDLQSQINGKANTSHTHVAADVTDFSEAVDDRVGSLLVAGNNISLSYDDGSNSLTVSANISGTSSLLQGIINCDTTNSVYTINHTSVDLNFSFPTVSLIVPASGSNLFVNGITNRSATSFNVTLSEVPNITGYAIAWHLPTTNSSLNSIPIVNFAITSIPLYTTTTSGSYSVALTDSVVYADNNNTILLPSSPSTGESHWIVNTYTSDITIDGNGKNISVDGVNYSTLSLTPDSSMHLHFNTTKNKWYVI
jgi:hypothetical protein